MYDLTGDTIVAISSPVGRSMRGVIRLSGPRAVAIAASAFRAAQDVDLTHIPGHRRVTGRLTVDADGTEVPALAYVFRAPRSYTREDVLEIHLPGSPLILSTALQHLLTQGARAALPGEFTARAFVHGRLDLTEAEGVAAVIAARSDAQLEAANRLCHGAVARAVAALQERLADLLSLVEADIDFSEEQIEFISAPELIERVGALRQELADTQRVAVAQEELNVLPTVMLAGPPNAGKSSLLNALSGIDRAICSPLAGTTRDVLSAPLELKHTEALLVDAAGLGDVSAAGELDRAARELARHAARQADVIVFVIDAAREPLDPHFECLDVLGKPAGRIVYAANKIDLLDREELSVRCEALRDQRQAVFWPVSAVTGAGIERLRDLIESQLDAPVVDRGRELLALNARHRAAIADADAALSRASELCREDRDILSSVELLACELREASDSLGTITGVIHPEELLERIFGKFCIGK